MFHLPEDVADQVRLWSPRFVLCFCLLAQHEVMHRFCVGTKAYNSELQVERNDEAEQQTVPLHPSVLFFCEIELDLTPAGIEKYPDRRPIMQLRKAGHVERQPLDSSRAPCYSPLC